MKKILILATAAFLVSGISFAQDKKTEAKKCDKECCKGKDGKKKECDMKDMKNCDKKETKAKTTATKKA